MAKGWIVLGFAAGYLVGSASGRKQFERIKSTVNDLWDRPEVQNTVKKVDSFVESKAPAVHDLGAAAAESVSATSPKESSAESTESTESTDKTGSNS